MAHKAGKAGAVYVFDQLVEDCEDAWSVAGSGTADSAAVDTDHKVGDYSVKMVCGAGVNNGDILATEVVTSMDLEAYTHLMYWIQSSENIGTEGNLQIGVSETADMGGSPVYSDVPVLTADTWKHCISAISTSGLDAVISVGAKLAAGDPGAFNLFVDDIRAGVAVGGIKSWTLDYIVDALDTTDFADAGVATIIPGVSRWSGTFEGFKDGVPLTIGTLYSVSLKESQTDDEEWLGNIYITGVHAVTSHDGIVTYSYDFVGTGDLTVAAA